MTAPEHPVALTHIGVTVPDCAEAMKWYANTIGFERLTDPVTIERGDPGWERASDLLGVDFDGVTIGHMTTANQVGFEIFSFESGADLPPEPQRSGFSHVCVVDPDLEALASRIDRKGGSHYSDVWTLWDGGPRVTYCKDPYGNRIEICTQSYERIQAARR